MVKSIVASYESQEKNGHNFRFFINLRRKLSSENFCQKRHLWVFHSREVVIFILAAGRSHDVPEEHLGPVAGPGIMVVDRYKAYQAVDKVKSGLIVLAFCWAHVRRDFLATARSWPDQEAWAMGWVERIGELYRLNDQRLEVRDDAA